MAQRTFLHVGTPKSGTTYLQHVLWTSAAATLRRHGLLLPGRRVAHYAAAKAVTGHADQKQTDIDPARAWPDLVAEVNGWDGDALIFHELFAAATARQAARAKSALAGSEVHLVITARSLARQVPAAWQQQVKAGLSTSYDEYLHRLRHGDPVRDRFRKKTGKASWFWRVQDLDRIASRWGSGIRPEHVHVVTVPAEASDPGLLWRRYASVFGVERLEVDTQMPRRNASLGRVETELLRRVHAEGDPRLRGPGRHRYSRGLLASTILAQRPGSAIGLRADMQQWVADLTRTTVRQVQAAGFDVVGDLDDLWAPAPVADEAGGAATEREVEEACDWAIERLAGHLTGLGAGHLAPAVGPGDGVRGVIELLARIRAADTGQAPRPRVGQE